MHLKKLEHSNKANPNDFSGKLQQIRTEINKMEMREMNKINQLILELVL